MRNYFKSLTALFIVSLLPMTSFGHGGVSIEDDVCVMQLATLKAHFTGYQPEYRATKEFCEDIPVVGRSIFVIDFISNELRDMHIDFRIIEDVNNIGNSAVLDDLGGPQAIEDATIFYQEKAIYPRGTLSANFDFVHEGRYIGIVTASYDDNSESATLTSVFPFQVGVFDYWQYIIPVFIIVLLSSAVFGVFLGMNRKNKN